MKRSNVQEQADLFSSVPAAPALTSLQLHHDELVDLLEPTSVGGGQAPTHNGTRRTPMSKISSEHLARGAYVYVRQSTADQLRNNHESRRRQYALADRARAARLVRGRRHRRRPRRLRRRRGSPGFERLLAAICSGLVGAVVSIEASRLARNGRDWHTLLEFCALVGSIIIDEDGVYDPRSVNDRLLLGMKGTMSEMELSLLRQRSVEALKLKAARGDLHTTVAIGFVRSETTASSSIRTCGFARRLRAVFARFAQAGQRSPSAAVVPAGAIELPSAVYDEGRRSVLWRLPTTTPCCTF